MTLDLDAIEQRIDSARSWLRDHEHFHSARRSDVWSLSFDSSALIGEVHRLRAIIEAEATDD